MDVFAQKIVFTDEFNTKNIAYESAGGARIVEDSVTKEKVLIYSGKKEILFYQLDPKWKIIRKLSKNPNKESQFSDPSFTVLKALHNKDRWTFIVRNYFGYSKETVDFATEAHTVDGKFLTDMAKDYREELFIDGSDTYVMYLNKSKELSLASFSGDLTINNIRLDLNSALPVGKSKKYTAADLYGQITTIDSFTARSPYFTRRKVQLYVAPDRYSILISGEEPVVELNQYDKKTGKKIKSQLYSVQPLLPKGSEVNKFNTASILFNNKVHVLTANNSGGVYAAFDAESKQVVYQYAYNEKDKTIPFNYGPVTYETLPGTISTSVLKEKVEDITMEKFCSEMYKHSCALTARYMDDGKLLISLANYDMKELAAATSTLRSGMNTMTSSDWYVSTSAGLLFEPGGWQVSAKKTTWNEINNSKAGEGYKKVEAPAPSDAAAEYNDKRSYVLKTQFIGNRRYTIYFTASKELKIYEKILKSAPPKIIGLTD
jgi:hypothetical protein